MDKVQDIDTLITHNVTLVERKNITISGVKRIESFDTKEFIIETLMGIIIVKGENLEIIKLDTYQGIVSIKGKINEFTYAEDSNKKNKEDSILSRLFK